MFNKFRIILLLFLLLAANIYSQNIKRALFLGNSYTNVNDLPSLVKSLALSVGDSLYVESNTPGGYTLQGHSTNAGSLALIQQGGWDYVVLQEQSQMPSFPDGQVAAEVFPYAKILDSIIHVSNPCAKTVFYMTWGRKNGDALNCSSWPPVCTYLGMDSLLNLRYTIMANANKSLLCPAGYAWRYTRANYPGIELYDSDESHPSMAGSYLTAACFYTLFFQKSPALIHNDAGLDAQTTQILRHVAELIVWDSLSNWNVGKWQPVADFVINQNGSSISCSNFSSNSDTYFWDFGDGSTSSLQNPSHTYQSSSHYVIKLEVSKCGKTDTMSTLVIITGTGLNTNNEDEIITIFPNPSNGTLNLVGADEIEHIEIFNSLGLLVFSASKQDKIVVNLPKGIYICKIRMNNKILNNKIIVH